MSLFRSHLIIHIIWRIGLTVKLQPNFSTPQNNRTYATSTLLSSFTKPTSTEPCLLMQEEVITAFHELGHSFHALLSQTKYARFNGWTATASDFIEVPSMLLEYWCWSTVALKRLSHHFKTGQPLPDDMINNPIHASGISKVFSHFLVALSLFDQAVYTPASHKEA